MKIANMKLLVGAFMALTLAMLSPAVLANDNNDIRKAVVVKFAKKAYSANYYGRIDGYKYDSYKFYAKKGQKLKVTLTGGNVETYLWGNQLKDSINLGEYSPELDLMIMVFIFYLLQVSMKLEYYNLDHRQEKIKNLNTG